MTTAVVPERLVYPVVGSRRLSVYFWAVVLTGGGLGFVLSGLSSYLHRNLLPFSDPASLLFIPQGITMLAYGVAALLAALYQWLTVLWDVGGGYNEFDQRTQQATIVRYGFPGQNRLVKLTYGFDEIVGLRVQIKEGLNPKRALYLRVKGRGDIPLTRVGQPLTLAEIENQAAELARFLNVPLEGI
ncbi:MAG: photosystem I assembly protein Ycf4 [Thermostichales cyanobacterium SZTDM-1c_bins_54]